MPRHSVVAWVCGVWELPEADSVCPCHGLRAGKACGTFAVAGLVPGAPEADHFIVDEVAGLVFNHDDKAEPLVVCELRDAETLPVNQVVERSTGLGSPALVHFGCVNPGEAAGVDLGFNSGGKAVSVWKLNGCAVEGEGMHGRYLGKVREARASARGRGASLVPNLVSRSRVIDGMTGEEV